MYCLFIGVISNTVSDCVVRSLPKIGMTAGSVSFHCIFLDVYCLFIDVTSNTVPVTDTEPGPQKSKAPAFSKRVCKGNLLY